MAKPTSKTLEYNEKKEKEKRKNFYAILSEEEKEQYNLIREQITGARDRREQPKREFDDHTFSQMVQMCRDGRVSYLGHVKNKGEVRVKTGTTEGKLDAIVNVTYNQNIEPEVLAFNQNDIEDWRLSEALTKINFRTEQMEDADDFWYEFVYELCSMPAAYIKETCEYETSYQRVIEGDGDWYDYFLTQKKDYKIKKEAMYTKKYPKKHLLSAEKVFLGNENISARNFEKQPYIIEHDTMSYQEARAIYGESPRWEYVCPGQEPDYFDGLNASFIYDIDWRLSSNLEDGQVEEVIWKSKEKDEIQIFLNGVPMLPPGTPMKSKTPRYNIKMYVAKPIRNNFAYGRPIPMMTRVMQALKDENFRLTILKFRQSVWQPIVTRAEKTLKKEMWLPGQITYGVDRSEIQPLTDNKVGNDDFGMSDMVKSEIDNMINVNPLLQGQSAGSRATAEEVSTRMRQALIMIGSVLVMYMRAKRDATHLRIQNVIENFTDPVEELYNGYSDETEKVYQSFTISNRSAFAGPDGASTIIQFMDRPLYEKEKKAVLNVEKKRKQEGKPIKFNFINIKKLAKIKEHIYVTVTQKPKRTSALEKESFKKDVMDMVTIAPQIGKKVNPEYIGDELARRSKLDPAKVWQVNQPQAALLGQGQGQGQGQIKDLAGRQPRPKTMQPSIKNMAQLDNQSIQV